MSESDKKASTLLFHPQQIPPLFLKDVLENCQVISEVKVCFSEEEADTLLAEGDIDLVLEFLSEEASDAKDILDRKNRIFANHFVLIVCASSSVGTAIDCCLAGVDDYATNQEIQRIVYQIRKQFANQNIHRKVENNFPDIQLAKIAENISGETGLYFLDDLGEIRAVKAPEYFSLAAVESSIFFIDGEPVNLQQMLISQMQEKRYRCLQIQEARGKVIFYWECQLIPYPDKQFSGLTLCIFRKIDQHIVDNIHVSEASLLKLLEISDIALCVNDVAHGNIQYNACWKNLLGYESDELPKTGDDLIGLMLLKDPQGIIDYTLDFIQGKIEKYYFTARFRKKSGEIIVCELHGFLQKNKSGNVEKLYILCREITDLVTTRKTLARLEDQFKLLLNTLPDHIYKIKSNGTVYSFQHNAISTYLLPIECAYDNEATPYLKQVIIETQKFLQIPHAIESMRTVEISVPMVSKMLYYEIRMIQVGLDEAFCIVRDTTQKTTALQSVSEKENTLRAVLEAMPDPIIQLDFKGLVMDTRIWASAAYLFDTFPEIGFDMAEFFSPSFQDRFRSTMYKVRKSKEACQFEFEHQRNESIYLIEARMTYHKEFGYLLVLRDRTHSVVAEKKIRESRKLFQAIFEHSAEAVFLFSLADLKLIDCNTKAIHLLGVAEKDKLTGLTSKQLNLEAIIEQFWNQEAMSCDLPLRQFTNFNGRKFWIKCNITRITAGKDPLLLCNIADITELQAARIELQDSRERLALALWCGKLGTWEWNETDQVINMDKSWNEILGYTAEEINFTTEIWMEHLHPEDMHILLEEFKEHLEGKKNYYECEFRYRNKYGEWLWILSRGKTVEYNAQGFPARILGANMDITKRKLYELEQKNKQNQLARALLDGQDDERQRLAYILHEQIGQHIYAIKLSFYELIDWATNLQGVPLFLFDEIENYIDEALKDINVLSKNLIPGSLKDFGLEAAIRNFCFLVAKNNQVRIHLEMDEFEPFVATKLYLSYFRIIQELLSLILEIKISTVFTLKLRQNGNVVEFHLIDNLNNLKDFLPEPKVNTSLAYLNFRVFVLNGKIDIQELPEGGSKIVISLPIEEITPIY